MQPRNIVISALILAALLAGALMYLLNSNSTSQLAVVSPEPSLIIVPSSTPAFFPTTSIVPPTRTLEPRITAQAAHTSAPVKPTAKTGPSDWLLPLLALAITGGAFGLKYQFNQV